MLEHKVDMMYMKYTVMDKRGDKQKEHGNGLE